MARLDFSSVLRRDPGGLRISLKTTAQATCLMLTLAGFSGSGAPTRAAELSYPNPLSNHLKNNSVPAIQTFPTSQADQKQNALTTNCQAARRDEPTAFLNLGWMYLNGIGVARNDAVAVRWLRQAEQHHVPQATNLLALMKGTQPATAGGCAEPNRLGLTAASPAVEAIIDSTAKTVGISQLLLRSVISVESNFNANAVSKKNAIGLMQLMPGTAARLEVQNRFDPVDNVRAGATHLKGLIRNFHGDLNLALAAYNAGEQAVRSHGGVPAYTETRAYVAAVMRHCACRQGATPQ